VREQHVGLAGVGLIFDHAPEQIGGLLVLIALNVKAREREVQPGIWQAIDIPEDALLIGTGGALDVLTDGDVRPLNHRVRQLSTSAVTQRYSVSMFVNPRPDIKINLLRESSGGAGDEADQRGQTFEAWVQERVRRAQQRDGAS